MRIVISSGHGLHVRGAKGYIDEVDEARKVVNKVAASLRALQVGCTVYHDDVSKTKNDNLKRIVSFHNGQKRDLDVSVHFNDTDGGNTPNAIGCEVWYVSQAKLAKDLAATISIAGGFKNRGPKKTNNFYFLNQCHKPAVLLEICFVKSKADTDAYKKNVDAISNAIARTFCGEEALPEPPPTGPDTESRSTLRKGDTGEDVRYLQQQLNSDNRAGLAVDGDFGSATDSAVRTYQASRRLAVDGIVGPDTWYALETDMEPYQPPELPPPLTDQQIGAISDIAIRSAIAGYNWKDRGKAPTGYTKGIALAFAATYRQYNREYAPTLEMASAQGGDENKDALTWYDAIFSNVGMNNTKSGPNTLRHLFVLIMGLGLRESSGKHCEGRDMSAQNTDSNTCEAGAWQTSYDAHTCSSNFDVLFNAYLAGGGANPQGFVEVFRENVSCSSSSWKCYGSGNGYKHQQMSKEQPAYAAEVCAITLRKLRKHYGPINEKKAEIVPAADAMLLEVQNYIDSLDLVA